MALTLTMMVVELVAGSIFGSMALIADGWHMSTHAGALAITALAYVYARRHAEDPAYTFGTGKFGDLAGFTSAVILAVISLMIAYQSADRLVAPVGIAFDQAIVVAVLGLVVNLVSAYLLHEGGEAREHRHNHAPEDGHGHHDTRVTITATTISARPISTCWPTGSLRCWRSWRSRRGGPMAGCGWTR